MPCAAIAGHLVATLVGRQAQALMLQTGHTATYLGEFVGLGALCVARWPCEQERAVAGSVFPQRDPTWQMEEGSRDSQVRGWSTCMPALEAGMPVGRRWQAGVSRDTHISCSTASASHTFRVVAAAHRTPGCDRHHNAGTKTIHTRMECLRRPAVYDSIVSTPGGGGGVHREGGWWSVMGGCTASLLPRAGNTVGRPLNALGVYGFHAPPCCSC
jgi:hypothetical protein